MSLLHFYQYNVGNDGSVISKNDNRMESEWGENWDTLKVTSKFDGSSYVDAGREGGGGWWRWKVRFG